MSGCARRSTSCRRASCSSTPTAATFSGTRNMPRSTTAVPTCSAGRQARGHAPHRRRARRLSGSGRPRGRVDRRAAGQAVPARRTPRADAERRPRDPDRGAADRDGGIIGLRVDITELKQREASFRLLFDSNPVPMIVCALDDERILGVNDAAIEHYGYSRAEFERMTIRSVQAFETEAAMGGRPLQRRTDRAHLEACQGRRRADRSGDLFAPAGPRRPARRCCWR